MTLYAEKILSKSDWINFDDKIMKYLAKKCYRYYRLISSQSRNAPLVYDEFLFDELNIRVALTRYLEMDKQLESIGIDNKIMDFNSTGSNSIWTNQENI